MLIAGVYEGVLLEALNALTTMLVPLAMRILLFIKEYSLLVNEEISVDNLDKSIRK